ncbi:MAG: hypothetical protein J6Z36_04035 [Clostridia bacterium]|nr:hypothetical protein [Clostridia bacterium]
MKVSCILCGIILIAGSFFAAVYGLFSVDLLFVFCFKNEVIYRIFLVLEGIAGLWLLFWLTVFRPQNKVN